MTEQIDYNIFVNDNNREFVNAIINSGNTIELYKILITENVENTKIWTCLRQGEIFKLTFYNGEESIDYFTHEILHAYFLTHLQFADTKDFYNDIQTNSDYQLILPLGLIGHINNIFAHEKFYKTYIEKKFLKEKFTSDFNELPVFYRTEIDDNFEKFDQPNIGILYFISTFFSCKDNRSGLYENEINEHFEFLKLKNKALFEILNTTWEIWLKEEEINLNKKIISNLIVEIKKWYREKTTNG
jgi:hypothetical protein